MMREKRLRRLSVLRNQSDRLDRRLADLGKQGDRLTRWRLLTFILIFMLGAAVLLILGPVPWLAATFLLSIPFMLTVRWHRQVDNGMVKFRLLRELKQSQVARLTLDWDQIPAEQAVYVNPDHPFAYDLDIIGERSLCRLLDVSVTSEGGQRLRSWLLETEPDPQHTKARQMNVSELIQMPAFRDRLILNALYSADATASQSTAYDKGRSRNFKTREKLSGQRLLDWLETRSDADILRIVLIAVLILAGLNLLLLAGYLADMLPPVWIATWFVYAVILFSQSRKVEPLFRDAAYINDNLRRLTAVFSLLEKRSFAGKPALQILLQPLNQAAQRPSTHQSRANRLLTAVGLRINPFVGILLNIIFPWDVFFGYRMQNFKQDLAGILPVWLDLWYELEALNGLATFGYLNPQAPFPEFLELTPEQKDNTGQTSKPTWCTTPVFLARNIGHPLIDAASRVGNDFFVDHLGSITIITGSNMAGKSSFLRTIGINIRLALAGAPVLAESLRLVPFRVATSITIADSVTDGFSFFYAEVRRLTALLEDLKRPHQFPLFFLIDEIFRGTNNRERLIGSRSYVNALLGSFGAGAIATHDLELVKLADVNADIRNAHFRDDVQEQQMVFDYKLHDGPCPTTNALKIMQLAGLPVDRDTGKNQPL